MKKENEIKTNAMRYLDNKKIPYRSHTYECEEFIDGITTAHLLGIPLDHAYNTLVTVSKSQQYYVFVLPVDRELDLKKAARTVGEKGLEMIHVKDINHVTGYVRGGCTPLAMKKKFPTIIEKEASTLSFMMISGGRLGSQIELKPDDLILATSGKYADIVKENHSNE